jgi:hypothetical protein
MKNDRTQDGSGSLTSAGDDEKNQIYRNFAGTWHKLRREVFCGKKQLCTHAPCVQFFPRPVTKLAVCVCIRLVCISAAAPRSST